MSVDRITEEFDDIRIQSTVDIAEPYLRLLPSRILTIGIHS